MFFFETLFAAMLSFLPVSGKLAGTWLETEQIRDCPRTVLRFEGKKLHFEHMFGTSATVKYKVIDKNRDKFTVTFDFTYKYTKPNGNIVNLEAKPELIYHVENGRPILSETAFEHDGRGTVIMREFLREKEFEDGFVSELKKKLNDSRDYPRR
ncbi:MAG: hypothetical protein Q4F00_02425 [bacterium]|nr:hypothetical protein [bacterium]